MASEAEKTIKPEKKLARIPQPPEKFLLGNMLDLSAATPVQDMVRLAREYGPIYRMVFRGRVVLVVSGHELVNELSDESRFDKTIRGALGLVRRFAGDGLFTAKTQELNWSRAHNILLPNFSQRAMKGYHPMMLDIAEQLVLKWERLNADEDIDVVREMTNLTVDTIGLCGFGYRFNSFYHDAEHPFVSAMANALGTSMDELSDMPMEKLVQTKRARQFQSDVRTMNEIVDRIIKDRRASNEDASDKTDLLSYMLSGVDKKSGERLDDLNIRYQVITFLIAGHETTSGLLSFVIYHLLNHPEVAARAYKEVDRVLGDDFSVKPTFAQINQLTFITQILKETLRLYPTAPAYALVPYADTVLGGRYKIKRHHQINVLLPMLHRDPSVWGERAEVFNPDNFAPEREAALPPNAYKPFGNGQRACIGRQFALQEATLVIGMILQRFKLIDHTRYELKIKETLTMKPNGFKIRVRLRRETERTVFKKDAETLRLSEAEISLQTAAQTRKTERHETPLLALYGSNMGTAEELARRIAEDAEENGFAVKVAPLDDYTRRLPKEGLVFITSSSYNGKPPDNAAHFCEWLEKSDGNGDSLNGVTYAVFGCGNRDWATTFQAVPRFIDERLAELGARRFYLHGEGDARDDFEGQFQSWYQPLRSLVATELKLKFEIDGKHEPFYKLEIVTAEKASPFVDSFAAQPMRVAVNRELHRKEGAYASPRSTRHIELELPEGITYAAGDHLGVIPHNSEALVRRVAARFGFERDAFIRLRKMVSRKTFLPTDETISAYRLLTDYVELQETATRTQIGTLIEYTECPPEKIKLAAWTGTDERSAARYREEVFERRVSLIDLLEEFPACELPFEVYLEMLSPLRPRYYSISSSPLATDRVCSITVAVLEGEARSGHGTFTGVCTNYLRRQTEGSMIYAFVKDTKSVFRLPDNPATPIIMIGPGTGIAPFRGFLQERAAFKAQGHEVGQSILFFGCRHPQQDFIYEDELRRFEKDGVTRLSTSFSRVEGEPKCYVQNEIYVRRDEVWQMLEAGAVIYVCGDASRMAPDVWRTFAAIFSEKMGANTAEAELWLNEMTAQNRYLVDVWSSN
ncbi:MAG TPA: cytochrome P450 [Pyrinomonadaceae bacterium]|jgi:cytochrome P450/NADPH-cytochrome P450 reductase|nr:cytochrome P450 [Pyrinomonadaceae bacterium]